MSNAQEVLGQRIRELRRRHYGARGKRALAERLGVPLEEYERYERGVVPPGDVLVRICEATGEDLQWLLTGVAARGTVVISGTRGRHQDLLARLAMTLDQYPELASPVTAFLDLLVRSKEIGPVRERCLPPPRTEDLIPIFDPDDAPEGLPTLDDQSVGHYSLLPNTVALASARRERAQLVEPAMQYSAQSLRDVEVVIFDEPNGRRRRCLRSPQMVSSMPGLFGVRLADEAMSPMFHASDAVLVAIGAPAKIGQPALCRIGGERAVRCRIWLGPRAAGVALGRLDDGETEHVPAAAVVWSLEVLYRLALAA